MRRLSHGVIVLTSLLTCGSVILGAPQAEKIAPSANKIPPHQVNGAATESDPYKPQTVQVELTSTIRAKKAKVGDLVKGRTVTALILPGQVVIPEDSKVIGHVTQASVGGTGKAAVTIAFDRFELKKRQVVAANFAIRSGAMRERAAQPVLVDDGVEEASPRMSTSSAPSTQKPTHMTMGGFTNSTRSKSTQAPPSGSRPQQPAGPTLSADNRGDLRAVSKGMLIGMPGVALRLDDVSGGATFESANRKLALKSGLQLMLSVAGVKAAGRRGLLTEKSNWRRGAESNCR